MAMRIISNVTPFPIKVLLLVSTALSVGKPKGVDEVSSPLILDARTRLTGSGFKLKVAAAFHYAYGFR